MKRKILLLCTAAALAAAFAAPSNASALMNYYKGKPIEKPIPVELGGSLNFITMSGGFDCVAKITMETGTTDAKVTELHLTTLSCVGTGGWSTCKVTGDTKTNLPWTTDTTSSGYTITNMSIDYKLECLLGKITLSVEELQATADNTKAIKVLTLSGTGVAGGLAAEVTGEFEVLGENSGAFSIAE